MENYTDRVTRLIEKYKESGALKNFIEEKKDDYSEEFYKWADFVNFNLGNLFEYVLDKKGKLSFGCFLKHVELVCGLVYIFSNIRDVSFEDIPLLKVAFKLSLVVRVVAEVIEDVNDIDIMKEKVEDCRAIEKYVVDIVTEKREGNSQEKSHLVDIVLDGQSVISANAKELDFTKETIKRGRN